jgi:putative hydrolase of the HAD superfamily
MVAFPIRHVLFDLGGTLMRARADWGPIYQRADQALADTLRARNIQLNPTTFRAHLHKYYEQRDQDFQETTYHFVLRELLRELGYAEVAEPILRSALDALYSVTQTNWELEDDALSAIQNLKSKNYQLGIFSNAGDDQDVQELAENFGIRAYFDFVLTSAACYYRKPHPRAFEIALARWNVTPKEAIMVGDSLSADIYGAKKLGMKTIWIARRAHFNADEEQRIQPDFALRDFAELLPVLEKINALRAP